jgi:hypothetical protein
MAKKSTADRRSADSAATPAGPRKEAAEPTDPLARARLSLARGNTRLARKLAGEIAASGPEAERQEAASILERTRPDPKALLAALAVIAVIVLAMIFGIFRGH